MNKRFTVLFICAFLIDYRIIFLRYIECEEKSDVKEFIISIDSFLGHPLLIRHATMACHIGLGMKLSPDTKFKD